MTDKGKEFIGKPFQDYLNKKLIIFFTSNSPDVKASVVERYNRTLKTRLYKFFTEKRTFRYLNVLPKIVNSINDSFHRMIGCTPNEVTKKNENEIRKRLYGETPLKKLRSVIFKFNVGDHVRITKEKKIFDKGYLPNFTEEIFVITERIPRYPVVYKVKDLNGENIEGIFYNSELVHAS